LGPAWASRFVAASEFSQVIFWKEVSDLGRDHQYFGLHTASVSPGKPYRRPFAKITTGL
jgi:hypothetical protein